MDSFYRYYLAEKMHPADDDALERALSLYEGAALKFSSDFISDAKQRENYNRNVKRMKELVLEEVRSKRTTVKDAAEYCSEMRNKIMAEIRAKTSVHGLAIAEQEKRIPKTLEQLLDKYAVEKFGKKFLELSEQQRNAVHYEIIEASARPQTKFNTLNKNLRIAGKVMIVVTIAYAAYEIANADNKAKETIKQGAAIGGGIAGTALAGLAVSTVCGPGAPICAIALLIAGGMAGGLLASGTADYFDEELEEFTKWSVS